MSKYDEKAVEVLLNDLDQFKARLADSTVAAIEALRPKPEMEYVLPEWDDWPLVKSLTVNEPIVAVTCYNRRIEKDVYLAIREATRIPARQKVRAGKDWTDAELTELGTLFVHNWNKPRALVTDAIVVLIDAINSKQGGQ
jgi:hypothetical protein